MVEIIPKASHRWGNTLTKEPTCTKAGERYHICSVCGEREVTQTLGKRAHAWGSIQTKAATCKKTGERYRVCSVCGEKEVIQILDKKDHTWRVTSTVQATCQKAGKTVKVCTVCGETEEETIPISESHAWGPTKTVKATCTATGKISRTCTICGQEEIIQTLPKVEHVYESEVTTPATVSKEGLRTFTCKNCKDTYTEIIPRGGSGIDDVVLGQGLMPEPWAPVGYGDLSQDHWAFEDMDQAAKMGILQGTGLGMEPNGTLTWGQGLTIAARTFAPDLYIEEVAAGTRWDIAAYRVCLKAGILLPAGEEYLPISEDPAALSAPIDRLNTLALLSRAIPEKVADSPLIEWTDGERKTVTAGDRLEDFATVPEAYQKAVERLFNLSILKGAGIQDELGNTHYYINGAEVLHRCDGAALFMRGLGKLDSTYRSKSKDVTVHFIDENGAELCPAKVFNANIGQSTYYLASELMEENPDFHYYQVADQTFYNVSTVCSSYTAVIRPMTQTERGYRDFEDKVERGEVTWEDEWKEDYNRYAYGENLYKHQLLFGTPDQRRYGSQSEAYQHQTTISFPVWKLKSNGEKYGITVSLVINAAIAEDVVNLFTEIYNDPEQFPIQDMGGYGWRGDSATGEHNTGTAIDINPTQNYQVRDGRAMTGTHWTPGEDPYSIPENGSVVRIFEKYGWAWGGNAWCGYSDQTTGYHDYMHFSYMGG